MTAVFRSRRSAKTWSGHGCWGKSWKMMALWRPAATVWVWAWAWASGIGIGIGIKVSHSERTTSCREISLLDKRTWLGQGWRGRHLLLEASRLVDYAPSGQRRLHWADRMEGADAANHGRCATAGHGHGEGDDGGPENSGWLACCCSWQASSPAHLRAWRSY